MLFNQNKRAGTNRRLGLFTVSTRKQDTADHPAKRHSPICRPAQAPRLQISPGFPVRQGP